MFIMKSNLCISIVFSMGLFVTSCSKNNDSLSSTKTSQESSLYRIASSSDSVLISKFGSIGPSHNEGLDFVFENLQDNFNVYVGLHTQQSRLDAILKDIQMYAVTYTSRDYETCGGVDDSCKKLNSLKETLVYRLETVEVSSTLRMLTDSIIYICNYSETLADLMERTEALLYASIGELESDTEKMRFISGVRIAQASWAYWDDPDNDLKWRTLFDDLGFDQGLGKPNGSSVVASDLVGGVLGGVRTAVMLAGCGPGGALAGFLFGAVAFGIESSAAGYLSGWIA